MGHIYLGFIKRVGVLYEHIKEFELLQNLDPGVIDKLKNDKILKQFKKKYHLEKDDDPFQYEIDGLAASDPTKFKKMILDEIKPFYDRQIYERLLSDLNHSEKQISLQIRINVNELLGELNMNTMWTWLES